MLSSLQSSPSQKHANQPEHVYSILQIALWMCFYVRFYLGGPTSVRGFGMYSIGPQSEGKGVLKKIEYTAYTFLSFFYVNFFLNDSFLNACFCFEILPDQVIIWVGKRIGPVGFTCIRPSPSAQTNAAWLTSSEHTSSLMLETFAISTTVSSHLLKTLFHYFKLRKCSCL